MLKGIFRPMRRPTRDLSPCGSPKPCNHSLREFSTPNGYFQCDMCKQQISVWQTMWGCRECNYDECENCYQAKVQLSMPKPTSSPSTVSETSISAAHSWTCPACTYENELCKLECDMCQSKRPGATNAKHLPSLVCTICCDAPCEVAFIECGHCVTCERCANSLLSLPTKQCPICRKGVSSRPLRIYFA